MARLAEANLLTPADLNAPRLVAVKDLRRFHSARYLRESLQVTALARIFALEEAEVDVDGLIGFQRRACGGTVAATLELWGGSKRVAVNLGGGFHHAEADHGAGFCIYNDIAVAIARLRSRGCRVPMAIVDLDFHQGNGNLVAFARDASVLTYSLHGSRWQELEAVANSDLLLPPGADDVTYLKALRNSLPELLRAHRPQLIFYVAGTDVLRQDPLGDFDLTPAAVLERDQAVAGWAEQIGAKLLVVLGGGYSPEAVLSTAAFVRWLLSGVAAPPRARETAVRRSARKMASSIAPTDLQRSDDDTWRLSESEILGDLRGEVIHRRLLDYYTAQGIEFAFERYGLFDMLRARGIRQVRIRVDPSEGSRQSVRIYGRRRGQPERLFVELVGGRQSMPAPPRIAPPGHLQLIVVQWLLLQDPDAQFSHARPPLPGQEHPGLDLAVMVQELLFRACHRVGAEGLLHRPAHYHNAAVASRSFFFLDPVAEGRFRALRRLLIDCPLAEASWAVERGEVRLGTTEIFPWTPAEQVLPVGERLRRYFRSRAYRQAAQDACSRLLKAGLQARR